MNSKTYDTPQPSGRASAGADIRLIYYTYHYLLQVFPTEIRTLGSGICVAVATVANAINSKVIIISLS